MRIAQVAPLYESVPPKLYGGTERVVSWLTDERLGGPPVYRVMLTSSVELHQERNQSRTNKTFEPDVLVPLIAGLVPQLQPGYRDRPDWIFLDNSREGIDLAVEDLLSRIGLNP